MNRRAFLGRLSAAVAGIAGVVTLDSLFAGLSGLSTGDTITIDGVGVVNPDPMPELICDLQVGDVLTFGDNPQRYVVMALASTEATIRPFMQKRTLYGVARTS